MLADGLPKGWVVRYDGGMERLRPYVWWVIPTLGVAAILGIVVGYPLVWLGCAAFNILGVWLFCDSKGSQHEKQQTWMKALTIALVPVGVVGVFASGGAAGGRATPRARPPRSAPTMTRPARNRPEPRARRSAGAPDCGPDRVPARGST